MTPAKVDGYWLRMGRLAIEALATAGRTQPMSEDEATATAEWFGYLLSEAHEMGMKLGEANAKYVTQMETFNK